MGGGVLEMGCPGVCMGARALRAEASSAGRMGGWPLEAPRAWLVLDGRSLALNAGYFPQGDEVGTQRGMRRESQRSGGWKRQRQPAQLVL